MTRIRTRRRRPAHLRTLAPRVGRLLSFLGCALSLQATPAAAQVTTAVPPSRGGHVAAPPWSGVSGSAPLPLTRARVTPPPVRHPAIHPVEVPLTHPRPLFPRAHQLQQEKRERQEAMNRHPAGKRLRSPAPRPGSGEHPDPGAAQRPTVATRTAPETRAPEPAAAPVACDLGAYRVRPGDSLWAISASVAAPGASPSELGELTDRIFEMNRPTIGNNPDLIQPGQLLSLPKDCQK